jgi:PAS domain S-box-containing protein
MRGLSPKILTLVIGVFTVITIGMVVFVSASSNRQMEQEWLARAETLNRMAFEALYANLAHGGGLEGNRQVIARLEEMGAFTNVRVVKGDPVIRQFGRELDELPQDELEQRALGGEEVGVILRNDGYRTVRYVTPLRIEEGCQQCHKAEVGVINGVISTEISLQEYEIALRQRRDVLLLAMGAGVLAMGLLTFYTLRRLVLQPLHAIQQGTAAIAQGNLDHRLHVRTGDELEAFAREFNWMVQRLQESYGQIAEEQNRIMTAIEASQDAIWISGADGRVVIVNSAMERLLGQSREELVGRECHELLCIHDSAGSSVCSAACSFLQSSAQSGQVEGYISAATGKEIWVQVSYGRVNDPQGRLAGGRTHCARPDPTKRGRAAKRRVYLDGLA